MDIESLLSSDELADISRWLLEPQWLDALTIEEIGDRLGYLALPEGFEHRHLGLALIGYWKSFKDEMRILICTDDEKYASLRKQLGSAGAKSQVVILTSVTAALAPYIGLAAGALVPMCAVTLLAIAQVGKNALCDGRDLDIRFPQKPNE
jgi:hypothetical protein